MKSTKINESVKPSIDPSVHCYLAAGGISGVLFLLGSLALVIELAFPDFDRSVGLPPKTLAGIGIMGSMAVICIAWFLQGMRGVVDSTDWRSLKGVLTGIGLTILIAILCVCGFLHPY